MIARTLNMRWGVLLVLVVAPLLHGCSEGSYAENGSPDQGRSAEEAEYHSETLTSPAPKRTDLDRQTDTIHILALGDSLTAGYGLDDPGDSFPARLEAVLQTQGYNVEILDAGISGDTSAGGRSRIEWSLSDNPDAVIVELGANDGLRAIDPNVTYDNLSNILGSLEQKGIPVLLAGMLAPPNLGREYGDRFAGVYQRLSQEYDVVFYPFFLDGVAGDPALNQDDRIHPNEAGVNVIVERIAPFAKQLVEQVIDMRASEPAS